MAAIRTRIDERSLLPGERLPSVRRFAEQNRLSPSTVVEAYERLVAEGLIQSRPGSGFYVTRTPASALPPRIPPRDRVVDPFWVSRQSLDMSPDALKPGCGWLPPDWLPQAAIRQALRTAARSTDALLAEYGPSRGALALRTLLLRQFAAEGLSLSLDQILLVGSASQAVDLVCRLLLRPGDTVLVDDPCYFNFRALLAAFAVRVEGVPVTEAGPDPDRFAVLVARHRPRLYLTNAALQNPTGATLSPPVAHRLLLTAAEHGLTVVEDDVFAALEPDPSVRLSVLDGGERVVRVGSFSKTVSSALRCGYVAAPRAMAEALTDLQVATSFTGPGPLAAEMVHAVLASGTYRKHLLDIRRRLEQARSTVSERLSAIGIVPWMMPRGGYQLWCRLPPGIDATRLACIAMEGDMLLAPGSIFSVSGGHGDFMRVNVTQLPDRAAIDRLAEIVAQSRP